LVAEGDHYEAQNPLTKAEISTDPSEGIAFEQAGVEVSVAAGSDAVQEVSEKLFFANADAGATASNPAAQPDPCAPRAKRRPTSSSSATTMIRHPLSQNLLKVANGLAMATERLKREQAESRAKSQDAGADL